MRNKLASAVQALEAARQNIADSPRSNKALLALVDAEEAYMLALVALAKALERLG